MAGSSAPFAVQLINPVKPDRPAETYDLELILDEEGFPNEYRMFLLTDICLDRVCNPLEATLVWDALGRILRIEYEMDNPLTKGDHEPFTAEDYDRMISILQNRDSILGRNPLDYFLAKPEERDDIDGITAATPQAVKDAVVEGAAYSSWALWHWANGEVQDYMKENTLAQCTEDYLLHGLRSGDDRFILYALRQLGTRSWDDPRIVEACLEILRTGGGGHCRMALDALARSRSGMHPISLAATVGVNPASTRMILTELKGLKDADPAVWDTLAGQLELLGDQNDLSLALNLLAADAVRSENVRRQVEQLLNSDDAIVRHMAGQFLTHSGE